MIFTAPIFFYTHERNDFFNAVVGDCPATLPSARTSTTAKNNTEEGILKKPGFVYLHGSNFNRDYL